MTSKSFVGHFHLHFKFFGARVQKNSNRFRLFVLFFFSSKKNEEVTKKELFQKVTCLNKAEKERKKNSVLEANLKKHLNVELEHNVTKPTQQKYN